MISGYQTKSSLKRLCASAGVWIRNNSVLLLFSAILGIFFSSPIVAFGAWFPMDIAALFDVGSHIGDKLLWIISPYNGTGRYVPFYWAYYCALYAWAGMVMWPYYLIQSLAFCATAFFFGVQIKLITNRFYSAVLLIFAIYFSSPLGEGLSTIGKAEPLSLLLIGGILLLFLTKPLSNGAHGIGKEILCSLFFVLAIWTKETSIALLGFAIVGLIFSGYLWKVRLNDGFACATKNYLAFTKTLLVGFLIAKLPYLFFHNNFRTASYLDYSITKRLIVNNLSFYINQQPDVALTGLLSVLIVGILTQRFLRTAKISNEDAKTANGLIVAIGFCAMGWAYYMALLLWRWPMGYYMLLPAVSFKFCIVYGIFSFKRHGLGRPVLAFCAAALLCLACVFAAFYNYYIIGGQISYSRIYTEAINRYADLAKGGGRLIVESFPFYSEQLETTSQLLKLSGHKDLDVRGIEDILNPVSTQNFEILKLLGVSRESIDANSESLPRSGDYVLTITGSKLANWFLRGVAPYHTLGSYLYEQDVYSMELVAKKSISLPAFFINSWSRKPSFGNIISGYDLYRVRSDGPKYLWQGRFQDGWMGKYAKLHISPEYGLSPVIKYSAPPFALPNKIIVMKDNKLFKEVFITDTDEKTLPLGDIVAGGADFSFKVQNSFVPKDIDFNEDTRALSLMIRLDGADIVTH